MAQPAPLTDRHELEGRVVAGRYRLDEVLGRGGFGAVYSGRDSASGEAVAVKVFSREEGLAPRADREARTARKLDHPNIHEVVGVAHDDDHAYLISQLVVGERFDRSDLDDGQAVRAIAAVCDALAHAHARGVVHRDVKPANILVSTDGTVHLTDFGIARDEDARDPTVDERLLGTLSYMAPEQARGERATGAADVWSAGLTLYATLVGRNPFKAGSLAELLDRLAEGTPPLHRLRPDLPRELSSALHRAMHSTPSRRPDAAELRDLLLAAVSEPAGETAPGWAPAAAPVRRATRAAQGSVRGRVRQAVPPILAGWAGVWTPTAFPVYPPSWTLPIAALLAFLAWRSPRRAAIAGSVVLVPAFWNFAEAAALVWAALAAAWLGTWSRWQNSRMLSPLAAGPLAMVGLGPAYVLIAAGAPTRRRRAAEALAGAAVAAVCGGWAGHRLTAPLAGAQSPLVYARMIAHDPAMVATAAAMVVFAVLLAAAREHRDRRLLALCLWGTGFAGAVAGIPQLVSGGTTTGVGAGVAALLTAIIPVAWAVAGPDLDDGR